MSGSNGTAGRNGSPDSAPDSRHALILHTSRYEDPGFRRLRAPVRDAAELADVLSARDIGGFAVTTVADATARQARVAIQEFLAARAVGDVAVIYLSCHGIRDRRNALYFVASDTEKELLEATALESQWLLSRLDDCAARSQVLILDCCFSGAFAVRAKGPEESDLESVFGPRGRGRAILTASRAYEYSFEGESVSVAAPAGSVYTTGLVEGIRSGEADQDGDGYISVLEAHEYARRYVRRSGVAQSPQAWLYGAEGHVWLARSLRRRDTSRPPVAAQEPGNVTAADLLPQRPAIFELVPSDLELNCVIPHALDDQWVSRGLIRKMAASRKSLHELGEERDVLTRREYLRALVSARKIVINRSYLLKNKVISRDYRTDPVSRAAFVELLRAGAIVPFLVKERTPIESEFAEDPDAAEGARVWNELLSTQDPAGRGMVEVQCVRLSWDDTENDRLVREQLSDAFAAGVRRSISFDYRRMLEDLGSSPSDTFEERLRLMPKMSASSLRPLTRSALYQRYVIDDRETVASGKYDFTKPDMVAFKWLFDLIYNSNLAAALGLALITPADSAHRSVVYRPSGAQQAGAAWSGHYDSTYLRTTVMETVQDAIFVGDYGSESLAIFDGLTLSDVVAIRNSDVWRLYSQALDALLAEPWLMSHPERGLPFVYGRYGALLSHISGIVPGGLAGPR